MAEVEIFTASYCPYCVRAKELLQNKGIEYKERDVTTDDEGRIEAMQRSGGKKTVPQIFIGGEAVGGFDDLYELEKQGKLDELLAG